jgi:hypothetical protein
MGQTYQEHLANPVFSIYFEEYVCIDSAVKDLYQIDSIICAGYVMRMKQLCLVTNDKGLIPGTTQHNIFENYGYDYNSVTQSHFEFFPPHTHDLGFEKNIYQMKLPMAWEISQGNPDITIADDDEWGNYTSNHSDVRPNFQRIITKGDGNPFSLDLRTDDESEYHSHGLAVLSSAIGVGDNTYSMIGTAPLW